MLSQLKIDDPGWKVTLDDFNMKLYNQIVTNKTAWYSFYFPVQLAMGLVSPHTSKICVDALWLIFSIFSRPASKTRWCRSRLNGS